MSNYRLPTTDSARIMALRSAIEKGVNTDFQNLSFSIKSLNEAKRTLAHFERLYSRYQQLCDIEAKAGLSFAKTIDNARMYISHFIQVLYMCVMRTEIKEEQLAFYGLDGYNLTMPDLSSCAQLLEWGEKIIQGEYQRILQGKTPIYTPSIAKVNVKFTLFKEGYQTQKLHEKASASLLQEVAAYRKQVDQVIFEIWKEAEKHNIGLPPDKQLA